MKNLFVIFSVLGLYSCGPANQSTLDQDQSVNAIRRAAFDLGSGSFKMKIADVDRDQQKIVAVVDVPKDVSQFKVDGADDLAKSADGNLSPAYQTAAAAGLATMVAKAKELGAKDFTAVATGVFRDAKNGPAVLAQLAAPAGIQAHIIDRQQEATLGYYGGIAASGIKKENLLVWDIGGQSMQMAFVDAENQLQFFSNNTASVTFKNAIISDVLGKDTKTAASPNPISPGASALALKMAVAKAQDLDAAVKKKLQDPATVVVGIGPVHFYSVGGQLGKVAEYSAEQVKALIEKRVSEGLDDAALGKLLDTKYAETEVSNAILVYGYMTALGIDSVKVFNVNNADGLLVVPDAFFTAKP